ncbi:PIG-L deacetylase family protein [Chromohalobacter nigrandesensis]|uniref:PIG-L deacetylase family protein n=1 Tax=Chromohalobacter nigrandesensis TaxID=119863 RepID=UPI001FF672D9|nr:PIG-L family deacetylase [Chromohalobacter nigrandesensis]
MKELLGKRILVIGAHPDDEVLGCGGLLAANADAGGESHVLIVSEGNAAQYGQNEEASKLRHSQLVGAGESLGVSQIFHWDYPDMRLDEVPHIELNSHLQNLISGGGYEFVFTHHPYDVNLDHKVVFQSVLVAVRPTPSCCVKGLFTYHVNSSTEWGMACHTDRFIPNAFLDISNWLDRKLNALSVYKDEIREYPHPRSIKAVRDRARVFGSEVGYEAAEAFGVIYWR